MTIAIVRAALILAFCALIRLGRERGADQALEAPTR